MSLYHIPSARNDEQRAMMEDLEARHVCIFCPENITEEDHSPIEINTKYWMVKKNTFPYKNTALHLLAIPKEHVATMTELSKPAQHELFEVLETCVERFNLESYGFVMRSGDMRKNGGSIEHLHAHIIVGDTDNPNHEPVRVKVSRPSS